MYFKNRVLDREMYVHTIQWTKAMNSTQRTLEGRKSKQRSQRRHNTLNVLDPHEAEQVKTTQIQNNNANRKE